MIVLTHTFDLIHSIRENYEKIFFADIKFAQEKDTDQLLWKSVYYKPIEEFRKIIKKYQQTAHPHPPTTNTPPQQQQTQQQIEKAQEKLRKTTHTFQLFLADGSEYYDGLYKRLKQRYDYYKNSGNAKLAKAVLTSLHKNLIIQGDLARYSTSYTTQEPKDWTKAKEHYYRALELIPMNGTPHNQLAVVATFQGDEC
jgi:protein SMG6